jgi:hypothetical protein
MDRSERRWRTAHKKARRLRYYWDYIGVTRGYLGRFCGGFWWGCRDIEKPWRIDGTCYMHEAPSVWVNMMMTRPTRREQASLLHQVTAGAD